MTGEKWVEEYVKWLNSWPIKDLNGLRDKVSKISEIELRQQIYEKELRYAFNDFRHRQSLWGKLFPRKYSPPVPYPVLGVCRNETYKIR